MSERPTHERTVVIPEAGHDRYHRQELISWWDQSRLRAASVLVVGAGALGNEIVKNLVLVGVGTVIVVDMDRIENSNLSRCVFFRAEDEGCDKARVLAARASELNPDVDVFAVVGDVRLSVGLSVFAAVDVVVAGLDSREARVFVNQACWKTTTPWVDGAIEGLMGTARVFVPPESACYECTLSERDHELLAARRTCALLTKDDMLAGKTPTTATTSSVIAGIQVQEAIKLLHQDRLGALDLAGAGYQYVGVNHDSYVVRYARRADCLSHDTYDAASTRVVEADASFGDLLTAALEELGDGAVLELEHEIAVSAHCQRCGCTREIMRPVDALGAGDGECPQCSSQWRLNFVHTLDADSPLLERCAADLGLPEGDVVVGRAGTERIFFSMSGGEGAIRLLCKKAAV